MSNTPPVVPKVRQSAYSWVMLPNELKNQVENYHTLSFTETARGAAIIFMLCLVALSMLLTFFTVIPFDSSTVVEWLIYCFSLYFVYKGHRWAILLVMFLWTGDKAYQLYQVSSSGQGSVPLVIFWWFIVMPYLYKALKVENARSRTAPVPVTSSISIFCQHCGSRQDLEAKFCTVCGKQMAATI